MHNRDRSRHPLPWRARLCAFCANCPTKTNQDGCETRRQRHCGPVGYRDSANATRAAYSNQLQASTVSAQEVFALAGHQRYLYGAEAEETPGGVKRDPFAP